MGSSGQSSQHLPERRPVRLRRKRSLGNPPMKSLIILAHCRIHHAGALRAEAGTESMVFIFFLAPIRFRNQSRCTFQSEIDESLRSSGGDGLLERVSCKTDEFRTIKGYAGKRGLILSKSSVSAQTAGKV